MNTSKRNPFARELLEWLTAFVFAVPGRFGQALRYQWGRWFLAKFGPGSRLGPKCRFVMARAISFGAHCSVGHGCSFTADGGQIDIGNSVSFNDSVFLNASIGGQIEIGDNCLFGPNVVLRTANHRFDIPDVPIRKQGHTFGNIHIEDDCWIAANVTVLPNVTIGRGAVIGAGAVVTRSVPPLSIQAGVPARTIGTRGQTNTDTTQ